MAKRGKPFTWASKVWWIFADRDAFRLLIVCFFLPGLLISLVLYSVETLVSGIEFNPATLTFRTFSFQRDPFFEFQLTGIKHDTLNDVPVMALDLIAARNQFPFDQVSRWDLVSISKGWRSAESGSAKILLQYLRATDSGNNWFWLDFAQREPKKSAALWKAVYQLVRLGFYSELPRIFELESEPTDADQFSSELAKRMRSILLKRTIEQQKAGNSSAAKLIASVGLTYGDNAQLQEIVDRHAGK